MNPILFESSELEFNTLGLGTLSDAISCEVEEERNGAYELTMEYPITGKHYSEIDLRRIILAKPNFTDDPQPFRIYRIERILEGIATIYAQHVSYDLADFAMSVHTSTGITQALADLTTNLIAASADRRVPMIAFDSNLTNQTSTFTVSEPSSLRSWLGGREGSLIDVFGGEWKFDKWSCYLSSARGADRGVKILYGKNLMQLDTEVKTTNVYTRMYGFWKNDEGELVTSNMRVITSSLGYVRTLVYDFSQQFENKPTRAQLNTACDNYIAKNNLTSPAENITLDFVQMDKLKERVDLCDTVTVIYDALGVSATKKCIRTKWDVLKGRYSECEFGDESGNIASTIAYDRGSVKKLQQTTTDFEKALTTLSGEIAEAQGFYTSSETDSAGAVTLYLHNSPNLADSTVIAKITAETASWSTDGGTTWNAVIDAQGRALFQHLYTVGIDATYIRTGLLQGTVGNNYWNLNTGKINIVDGQINIVTSSGTSDFIGLSYGKYRMAMAPVGLYGNYDGHQRTYLGPTQVVQNGPGRLYLRNTNDDNPSASDNIVFDVLAESDTEQYCTTRVRNSEGIQTVLIGAESASAKAGIVSVYNAAGTRKAYMFGDTGRFVGDGKATFGAINNLTQGRTFTVLDGQSIAGDAMVNGYVAYTPTTGYTPIGIVGYFMSTTDGITFSKYMNLGGLYLESTSSGYRIYYHVSNTGTNTRSVKLTAIVLELKTTA